MKNETKKEMIAEAKTFLLDHVFNKTTTVYCVLRNVSTSGMQRKIDFYSFVNDENGNLIKFYLTSYFDVLLNGKRSKSVHDGRGMIVKGCGMDMGFHVVNSVSSSLFRNADGSYSNEGASKLKSEWI